MTADELGCCLSDASPEVARGFKIGLGRRSIRALIDIRLRPGAQPEAETIEIPVRPRRGVVRGRQSEVDPMHAMLSREQSDLDQGGQLVSGSRARIGEPC